MSPPLHNPALEAVLDQARGALSTLLSASDDQPAAIQFAKRQLRLDVVRQLVTTPGDQRDWNGNTLDEEAASGRRLLELYQGPGRYVNPGSVSHVLANAAAPSLDGAVSETAAALVVNLLVLEPLLHPERERTLWLVVARALADGRPSDNVYEALPLDQADDAVGWRQLGESLHEVVGSDEAGAGWLYVRRHLVQRIQDEIDAPLGSPRRTW